MNISILGYREQALAVDARVAGLVEGVDVQLQALVLADHLLRVVVRVERVHQHQGHIAFVRLVQVL